MRCITNLFLYNILDMDWRRLQVWFLNRSLELLFQGGMLKDNKVLIITHKVIGALLVGTRRRWRPLCLLKQALVDLLWRRDGNLLLTLRICRHLNKISRYD
jgi:hypothetical protein